MPSDKETAKQVAAQAVIDSAKAAAKVVAETALAAANVSSAVLANNVEYIKSDITEIKQTLKEMTGTFVTKGEFIEVMKVQQDHEVRTRAIEQNMWKWMGMATVLSSVVGIVVGFILKYIKID